MVFLTLLRLLYASVMHLLIFWFETEVVRTLEVIASSNYLPIFT